MNRPEKPERRDREIDLAHEAIFALGEIEVRPSTREVVHNGSTHVLEPRVMQVLVALAQANGAVVSRDELCDRCWGGRIVGEDALQRAIGLLRRLAEAHSSSFTIETVPRVGYRLQVASTQERPREVDRAERTTSHDDDNPAGTQIGGNGPHADSRYRLAALVALAVTVVLVLTYVLYESARPPAAPLVAVLPFRALTADAETAAFANGLSEDVISTLLQTTEIRVAGRSSAVELHGVAPADAARALHASHILTGAVRREGDRLRITAQLIDADRNETLWSNSYDRTLAQTLALQRDLAGHIAVAFDMRVSAEARRQADLVDRIAYAHFIRGREIFRARDRARMEAAVEELGEAVRLAPHFSRAWSSLAGARFMAARIAFEDRLERDYPTLIASVRAAAHRALELDAKDAEALGLLALLARHAQNYREAEALLGRALRAEPNNTQVLNWYGGFLAEVGRTNESIEVYQRAYELDRVSRSIWNNLVRHLLAERRLDEAKAIFDLDHHTKFDYTIYYLLQKRDWRAAATHLSALPPEYEAFADFYHLSRDTARALASGDAVALNAVRNRWRTAKFTYFEAWEEVAFHLALLSDAEGVMNVVSAEFEKPTHQGLARPSPTVLFSRVHAAMRRDPRFLSLMRKLGLLAYWQESNHWPDFCADAEAPFDCSAAAREHYTEANR